MKLKNTKALVKSILETDQRARNSDNYLYLRVLNNISAMNGADYNDIPVAEFLLNMDRLGVPPFESVRRSRQKVQEEFPHLAASAEVQGFRVENEKEYRAFAISGSGADRCVMCGEIVPEGRQICPRCEADVKAVKAL